MPPEDDAEIIRSVAVVRVGLERFAKPVRGLDKLILLNKMDALCNEPPRKLRIGRLPSPREHITSAPIIECVLPGMSEPSALDAYEPAAPFLVRIARF